MVKYRFAWFSLVIVLGSLQLTGCQHNSTAQRPVDTKGKGTSPFGQPRATTPDAASFGQPRANTPGFNSSPMLSGDSASGGNRWNSQSGSYVPSTAGGTSFGGNTYNGSSWQQQYTANDYYRQSNAARARQGAYWETGNNILNSGSSAEDDRAQEQQAEEQAESRRQQEEDARGPAEASYYTSIR
jgi:hypothetical protein